MRLIPIGFFKTYREIYIVFPIVLLGLLRCGDKTNIGSSDFEFLLGDWQLYNALDGTETKVVWSKRGEEFAASVETRSDRFIGYNDTTEFVIYRKNGDWHWYWNHTPRTNLPSYHYELRKLPIEEYGIQPKPGVVTFMGKAEENAKNTFQLHWDTDKLLVKYNMMVNGYLFQRIE